MDHAPFFMCAAGIRQNPKYPLVNQHSYGNSPFLMGKSTIDNQFQ
jgi:hypothetical protein